MTAPFRRGSVVLRARRYSVVWEVRERELVVLPILRPRRPDGADVALDLFELAACGAPTADAVVRPSAARLEARSGAQLVGEVPAAAICRVVRGVTFVQHKTREHASTMPASGNSARTRMIAA